jgi:hypothetical protein
MESEIRQLVDKDESEGQLGCWFCFSCLRLSLGSDGGYANYDLDDEMLDDTRSAQVDIDPYAGLLTRRCRARAAEVHSQAFSFLKTDARKSLKSKRSPRRSTCMG